MRSIFSRRAAIVAFVVLALGTSAWAEESLLSKLNPFDGGGSSASGKKPSGYARTTTRKKAEPSLVTKTFTKIGQTTKSTWNKTTDLLSPKNLLPKSDPPPARKLGSLKSRKAKTTSSSWSPLSWGQSEEPEKPRTVGEFLKKPRL